MKLCFSVRDLLARLKRPQFSLRLMLLVTALTAVICSWRVALRQESQAIRLGQIELLEQRIEIHEENLAEAKYNMEVAKVSVDAHPQEHAMLFLWTIGEESRMKQLQRKLSSLRN